MMENKSGHSEIVSNSTSHETRQIETAKIARKPQEFDAQRTISTANLSCLEKVSCSNEQEKQFVKALQNQKLLKTPFIPLEQVKELARYKWSEAFIQAFPSLKFVSLKGSSTRGTRREFQHCRYVAILQKACVLFHGLLLSGQEGITVPTGVYVYGVEVRAHESDQPLSSYDQVKELFAAKEVRSPKCSSAHSNTPPPSTPAAKPVGQSGCEYDVSSAGSAGTTDESEATASVTDESLATFLSTVLDTVNSDPFAVTISDNACYAEDFSSLSSVDLLIDDPSSPHSRENEPETPCLAAAESGEQWPVDWSLIDDIHDDVLKSRKRSHSWNTDDGANPLPDKRDDNDDEHRDGGAGRTARRSFPRLGDTSSGAAAGASGGRQNSRRPQQGRRGGTGKGRQHDSGGQEAALEAFCWLFQQLNAQELPDERSDSTHHTAAVAEGGVNELIAELEAATDELIPCWANIRIPDNLPWQDSEATFEESVVDKLLADHVSQRHLLKRGPTFVEVEEFLVESGHQIDESASSRPLSQEIHHKMDQTGPFRSRSTAKIQPEQVKSPLRRRSAGKVNTDRKYAATYNRRSLIVTDTTIAANSVIPGSMDPKIKELVMKQQQIFERESVDTRTPRNRSAQAALLRSRYFLSSPPAATEEVTETARAKFNESLPNLHDQQQHHHHASTNKPNRTGFDADYMTLPYHSAPAPSPPTMSEQASYASPTGYSRMSTRASSPYMHTYTSMSSWLLHEHGAYTANGNGVNKEVHASPLQRANTSTTAMTAAPAILLDPREMDDETMRAAYLRFMAEMESRGLDSLSLNPALAGQAMPAPPSSAAMLALDPSSSSSRAGRAGRAGDRGVATGLSAGNGSAVVSMRQESPHTPETYSKRTSVMFNMVEASPMTPNVCPLLNNWQETKKFCEYSKPLLEGESEVRGPKLPTAFMRTPDTATTATGTTGANNTNANRSTPNTVQSIPMFPFPERRRSGSSTAASGHKTRNSPLKGRSMYFDDALHEEWHWADEGENAELREAFGHYRHPGSPSYPAYSPFHHMPLVTCDDLLLPVTNNCLSTLPPTHQQYMFTQGASDTDNGGNGSASNNNVDIKVPKLVRKFHGMGAGLLGLTPQRQASMENHGSIYQETITTTATNATNTGARAKVQPSKGRTPNAGGSNEITLGAAAKAGNGAVGDSSWPLGNRRVNQHSMSNDKDYSFDAVTVVGGFDQPLLPGRQLSKHNSSLIPDQHSAFDDCSVGSMSVNPARSGGKK